MTTPQSPAIVRRKEEWHCVLYHALVVLAYCLAFILWLNPAWSGVETLLDRIVFLGAAVPLLGWVSGINIGVNYHNHTHRPLFHSAALNRWFERIWTPFGGWPATYWGYYHVRVHHRHFLSKADWTVRQRRPNGELESCLRYQLSVWPWRSLRHFPGEIRRGDFELRTAALEMLIFLPLYSIPFFIDPAMGVCLWLLPHWFANCVTMGRGMFVQHAGCEGWVEDKSLPHSVNFPAEAFNITMFNIGYHIQHHDFPGLHWAELPHLAALQAAQNPKE